MAAAAQSPGRVVLDFSFNAGVNMSPTSGGPGPDASYQYTAVKPTANDFEVAPSSSLVPTGTPVLGILQNQPTLNQAATVRLEGISKCVVDGAAGAIAPGDSLKTDGLGRGIKTTSANDAIFAVALQGSTAQNDIISVWLTPGRY